MIGTRRKEYLFILPAVILVIALTIFPLLFSLGLSFCDWQLAKLGAGIRFNGIKNYLKIIFDTRFWDSLQNTGILVFLAVTIEYVIGLGLAVLLSKKIWGRRFFRVAFLMPMLMAPIAIGHMWKMLFHVTRGPLNRFISVLGFPRLDWIGSTRLALYSIILVDIWEWTPFMLAVLLAALQSLPLEPYEAARVDGASGWQIFHHITFPALLPVTGTVILLRAAEAFKIMDTIFVITGGGPGTATETSTFYVYTVALKHFNLGYASALTYILLVISIVFVSIYLRSRK